MSSYNFVTRIVPFFTGCMLLSLHINAEPYRLMFEPNHLMFEPSVMLPEITVGHHFGEYEEAEGKVDHSKRIVDRLSLITGKEMRVGVLRYRNDLGKGRYGFGYRKYSADQEMNAVLTHTGIMFAVEHEQTMFNIAIKNEEPGNDRDTVYIQFSFMKRW